MAIIICPECGKEFSDLAKACPQCGCPVEEIAKMKEEEKKTYKIVNTYNILGDILNVDEGLDKYLKIRKGMEDGRNRYIDIAKSIYYGFGNIDSLIEEFPEHYSVLIETQIKNAVDLLNSCGIYDIDVATFYKKYQKEIDVTKYFSPIVEKYLAILDYENYAEEYHNYVREARKHTWSGGGFGVKGALKGSIKAELMNVGTSFIHSFSDNANRAEDKVYVAQQKARLYEDDETQKMVVQAYVRIYDAISMAELKELADANVIEIYSLDRAKAKAIYNNIGLDIDIDVIVDMCKEAFFADPLYYPLISLMLNLGLDEEHGIENFAKDYGFYDTYIQDKKENAKEQYSAKIESLEIDRRLISNKQLFDKIDALQELEEKGVDVGQYIFEVVKNRLCEEITQDEIEEIKEKMEECEDILDEDIIEKIYKCIETTEIVEATEKKDVLQKLIKNCVFSYSKKISDSHFFVANKVRLKEIDNYSEFVEDANLPVGAEAYMIYASYNRKSDVSKYVYIIADTGLYCEFNDGWENLALTWKEYVNCNIGRVSGGIMVSKKVLPIYSDEFCDMLQKLQKAIKSYYEIDGNKTEKNLEVEKILQEVCEEYSSKFHFPIHRFACKKDLKKAEGHVVIIEGLHIPKNENIYYENTNVDGESLKRGFVITDRGIYWKNEIDTRHFMTWNEFKIKELKKDKKDGIYLDNQTYIQFPEEANFVYPMLVKIRDELLKSQEKESDNYSRVRCKKCGKEILSENKYCTYCGEPINLDEIEENVELQENLNKSSDSNRENNNDSTQSINKNIEDEKEKIKEVGESTLFFLIGSIVLSLISDFIGIHLLATIASLMWIVGLIEGIVWIVKKVRLASKK